MLRIPSLILLVMHLTAMQVAGAGPLIATLLDACGIRHILVGRLARVSWWSFWIGAIAGGAAIVPQTALAHRDYGPALEMFQYKLIWGVLELVVFVVALWGYLWGWHGMRDSPAKRGAHRVLGVFAATNLLYHFPPLMLLFSRVTVRRIEPTATLSAAAYREFAFRGDVLAASVHFWLASLVAAAVVLMVLAIRHVPDDLAVEVTSESTKRKSTGESPLEAPMDPSMDLQGRRIGIWATAIALVASMLQLPVGMWVLAELPGADQSRILGGDLWATGLLAIGFFSALALMQELATILSGELTNASVYRITAKFGLVTTSMMAASLRLGT